MIQSETGRIPETDGLLIEVPASHLYSGLVVSLPHLDWPPTAIGARPTEDGPLACILSFNDGSMSFGDLRRHEDTAWILAVDAYVTARKTQVAARRWRLDITPLPDGRLSGRIAKRLA